MKLVPDVHRHVVHSWSCVVGCDHDSLPARPRLRSLGAIDPAQVQVVDLHYAYDVVDEICHSGVYAP